jgi:hypothetical protein
MPHIVCVPHCFPRLVQVSEHDVTHWPAELHVWPVWQFPQFVLAPQTVHVPQALPRLAHVSVQLATHWPAELQVWPVWQ